MNVNATIHVHNELPPQVERRLDALYRVLDQLREIALTNQEKINSITVAINTATEGIRADIQALKDANAAGQVLDFTALDAKVAALAALDAENPATQPTA